MQPQPQLTKTVNIPAPLRGVTSETSLLQMTYSDAIYCFNMLPGDYGMEIREGYDSASGAIPVDGDTEIRTVIGYRGAKDDGSAHRLFAVTNLGIYKASDSSQVMAFSSFSGAAGYGRYTTYESIGGSYLFYCDEVNGAFRYEEDLDTWSPLSDLTLNGVAFDHTQIVNVEIWKNRLWFTIRDSSVAYYLPIGQIAGALTAFDFGNKFSYGGSLVGVHSWTLDGGSGLSDYLVAISRGGDVLVYQGLDPSNAASFGVKGSWYLGLLPAGRDFVYNYSGDLLVITYSGVVQMSALVRGTPLSNDEIFVTKRINRFVKQEMSHSANSYGWTITQHPRSGYLMVVAPPRAGVQSLQFVRSSSGAWTMFRGIPIYSVSEYLGELYIGTDFDRGHKVCKLTGSLDNNKPIQWSLVTGYSGYDAPGNFKRVQFIRSMFVGTMTPVYDVQARYDFDLDEYPGSPRLPDANTGIWDASLWDKSVWGEGFIADQKPYGGSGMGRHVAVALRGASMVPTTFLGFDVMMDIGGML